MVLNAANDITHFMTSNINYQVEMKNIVSSLLMADGVSGWESQCSVNGLLLKAALGFICPDAPAFIVGTYGAESTLGPDSFFAHLRMQIVPPKPATTWSI